jgi:putative transposase
VAIKDWKVNPSKYLGRPKLPKYKPKDGRFILGIDNNKVMIKDEYVYFAWKPLKVLNGKFTTNISQESKVLQCRFIPRGSDYIMEIVYEKEVTERQEISERIISIDLGVDNFVTITNNVGLKPFVIKGGVIKSANQYYNKEKAKIQSQLKTVNKKDWSNRLQRLTNKRNNKIKHLMHVYSKTIIDYCIENNIDTVVCGYNKEWKQESNMIKKTNQKFVTIPYEIFINQLDYKSLDMGKKFILNEESYTSGTSF